MKTPADFVQAFSKIKWKNTKSWKKNSELAANFESFHFHSSCMFRKYWYQISNGKFQRHNLVETDQDKEVKTDDSLFLLWRELVKMLLFGFDHPVTISIQLPVFPCIFPFEPIPEIYGANHS